MAEMIDVKQAVTSAETFARQLYRENELRHLRLEEVELSNDGSRWKVTLGWVEPAVSEPHVLMLASQQIHKLPRVYKVFEVDAETGDVRAMRIRDVN